jgi:hypothetical protein
MMASADVTWVSRLQDLLLLMHHHGLLPQQLLL